MHFTDISHRIARFIASRPFFYIIIAIFVFQALWFAFSALYPMAFDEDFHFGLIQVYAQQWGPFISEAPEGTGSLGALTREPSYLFAYLMSFPYRVIAFFTAQQEVQIILLRLINIALFTAGLFVFRKLLLQVKASPAIVHSTLLFFTLIPITPFLAAHINYDNLLFLLVPLSLILALYCAKSIKAGEFPYKNILLLLSLCLLTSIVKFPFLPIFAGIVLYLVVLFCWQNRKHIITPFRTGFAALKSIPLVAKIALGVLLIISVGLFLERYGLNYLYYHTLIPDCGQVNTYGHCSQYGPWIRNQNLMIANTNPQPINLLFYVVDWFNGMMHRLFFAINHEYYTRRELPIPVSVAYGIAISGVLAVIFTFRKLIRRYPALLLFMVVIGVYTAAMLNQNYTLLSNLGELVAVNGRYFIPLMPLILIIIALAFKLIIDTAKYASIIKPAFATLVLLLFLQGGGVITYIMRSDSTWHWQNDTVIQVNESAKSILEPVIYEGYPGVPAPTRFYSSPDTDPSF